MMLSRAVIILIAFLVYGFSFGKEPAEKQIREVFTNLVNAYGHPKAEPILEIAEAHQKTPAYYTATPQPKITVDERFYEICKTFGKDSLNALSIVLSHELAHYYSDHTFCTDFAFVLRNDDKELSRKLKEFSKSQMLLFETEADNKAIFYSAIAGYDPFKIYEELLDRIYKEYNLPDEIEGYPTKNERKNIYLQTTETAKNLYTQFLNGLEKLNTGNYDEAIGSFEELNRFFPSRENFNNLGVAKVYKALSIKPLIRNEYLYPERFSYPLSIDNISFLQKSVDRSMVETEDFTDILKSAQKDFEKAILLDPTYTKSYINLACVYDLLGNPEAAVGKIKELSKEVQTQLEAQKILAIAYYHMGLEEKAEKIWIELAL